MDNTISHSFKGSHIFADTLPSMFNEYVGISSGILFSLQYELINDI